MSGKDIREKYEHISHYTKVDTALEILESKKIRATNYLNLEDTKEIRHAKEYYLFPSFKKEFQRSKKDCEHDIDNIIYSSLGHGINISSFSKLPSQCNLGADTDGILSMWRYYAEDNGCYIRFCTKKLYESFNKRFNKRFDEKQAFIPGEVVYKDNDANCKQKVETVASLYKKFLDSRKDVDAGKLCEPFIELVALTKHLVFQDEREIRFAGIILGRSCPCSAEKHIDVPFTPRAVKSIVIGPSEEQEALAVQLRSYISGNKDYEHVKIEKTDIPIVMHQKYK